MARIASFEIPEWATTEQVEQALAAMQKQAPKPEPVVTRRRESQIPGGHEPLLTPEETGLRFRCDPKTITRWAKAGKIHSVRTLGGHRRYYLGEVEALLRGDFTWEPAGGWPEPVAA